VDKDKVVGTIDESVSTNHNFFIFIFTRVNNRCYDGIADRMLAVLSDLMSYFYRLRHIHLLFIIIRQILVRTYYNTSNRQLFDISTSSSAVIWVVLLNRLVEMG
jgi:hypothetical protein